MLGHAACWARSPDQPSPNGGSEAANQRPDQLPTRRSGKEAEGPVAQAHPQLLEKLERLGLIDD